MSLYDDREIINKEPVLVHLLGNRYALMFPHEETTPLLQSYATRLFREQLGGRAVHWISAYVKHPKQVLHVGSKRAADSQPSDVVAIANAKCAAIEAKHNGKIKASDYIYVMIDKP